MCCVYMSCKSQRPRPQCRALCYTRVPEAAARTTAGMLAWLSSLVKRPRGCTESIAAFQASALLLELEPELSVLVQTHLISASVHFSRLGRCERRDPEYVTIAALAATCTAAAAAVRAAWRHARAVRVRGLKLFPLLRGPLLRGPLCPSLDVLECELPCTYPSPHPLHNERERFRALRERFSLQFSVLQLCVTHPQLTSLDISNVLNVEYSTTQVQRLAVLECGGQFGATVRDFQRGVFSCQLNDNGFAELFKGLPLLRSFSLHALDSVGITDRTLLSLAAHCPALQRLELLFSGSKYGVGDSFVRNHQVTDAALVALGASCRQLRSVRIVGAPKLSSEGYRALFASGGVRELHWPEQPSDRTPPYEPTMLASVAAGGTLAGLERVEFTGWLGTGDVLALARECPQLTSLRADHWPTRRVGGPEALLELARACRSLTSLDLAACHAPTVLTDDAFAAVCGLPRLHTLRVGGEDQTLTSEWLTEEERRFTVRLCAAAAEAALSQCAQLRRVELPPNLEDYSGMRDAFCRNGFVEAPAYTFQRRVKRPDVQRPAPPHTASYL